MTRNKHNKIVSTASPPYRSITTNTFAPFFLPTAFAFWILVVEWVHSFSWRVLSFHFRLFLVTFSFFCERVRIWIPNTVALETTWSSYPQLDWVRFGAMRCWIFICIESALIILRPNGFCCHTCTKNESKAKSIEKRPSSAAWWNNKGLP